MSGKAKSGSHRKVDTARHRRRQKKEEANRAVKTKRRVQREAEFTERNFARRDAPSVCPLCNQPITEEDKKNNVHQVTIDHKPVLVHRTCPGD